MSEKIFNVLFICTGNSARSIMAEALLNTLGKGRFRAYSAGSHPTGSVNLFAIEQIRGLNYPMADLRSKSWDKFDDPLAPRMDFVITVCDNAAGEACPVWPGQPMSAHWGFQDPAALRGSDEEKRRLFARICREIKQRIDIFIMLPIDKLSKMSLKYELDQIGRIKSDTPHQSGTQGQPCNVLFLCTGNSARSVMAEALIDILGKGRFKGFSAGSRPGGKVNPFAVEQIKAFDPSYSTDNLRSKSWDEFAAADAPPMDFIITVCDNAAGESCPYWPGHPATAHWGFEDPAAVQGSDEEKRAAFEKIFSQILKKMDEFMALPIDSMDQAALRLALKKIGELPV